MKDILIIAHFTQVPGEKGNGRFHYLAERIDKSKANVEIVTSNFSHRTKLERNISVRDLEKCSYVITLIEEPGYKKNVSISRFYSHYKMGSNLRSYLKKRKKPDVIYCSIPSVDVANVASKFAKENNIPFIIDIQDLWPEAFKMIIKWRFISSVLFYSMTKKVNSIYSSADKIISVSNTYLQRAKQVNKKSKENIAIYLGTDLKYFDQLAQTFKVEKFQDEIRLTYIGTLGASYDIHTVIDALSKLNEKGIKNIKFLIIGDGPNKKRLEEYAKQKNVDCLFFGRLDYGEMVGLLNSSDIAVNPIMPNSAGSIINKVGDYAAAGLPVLNTQENIEYRELIEEYKAGINCVNNNSENLAVNIELLCNDIDLRHEMGSNNRRLAEEKFDREFTYQKIVNLIL